MPGRGGGEGGSLGQQSAHLRIAASWLAWTLSPAELEAAAPPIAAAALSALCTGAETASPAAAASVAEVSAAAEEAAAVSSALAAGAGASPACISSAAQRPALRSTEMGLWATRLASASVNVTKFCKVLVQRHWLYAMLMCEGWRCGGVEWRDAGARYTRGGDAVMALCTRTMSASSSCALDS